MLVRSPEGSFEMVDFRETAPAAAFQDMYENNTEASILGGLARYVTQTCHQMNGISNVLSVAFPVRFEVLSTSMRTMVYSHGPR